MDELPRTCRALMGSGRSVMLSHTRLALRLLAISALVASSIAYYDVKPFTVSFPAHEVSRMISLTEHTRLPHGKQFSGGDESLGISRDILQNLKDEWVHEYSWDSQAKALNEYHHFTVEVENTTLHFIHEKSVNDAAIPILLAHGWPGSFLEYLPTVPLLTQPLPGVDGRMVSYDVVIPSLPGFGFSSLPSNTWTPEDTTRIFNTLMVEVLGYKQYTVFGSDWGATLAYELYTQYSSNVRAAHFAAIPFLPENAEQVAARNISLSPFETEGIERTTNWSLTGNGYFVEHRTRPNTIGLALLDSPVGQLAWIGEKLIDWTDPDRSPPSTLDNTDILNSASLYFLTQSFLSAEWIYSRGTFATDYEVERPDAPMGYSAFRYNILQWPRALIEKVGNLTVYQEHARGGHFPGLDNPTGLVSDIRELGRLWKY